MTPLYDPKNPIAWRDLEFKDLVEAVRGRLNFHAYRSGSKMPDLDVQDILQELTISLWEKADKVPPDIVNLDYRFLRYIDTIFRRKIIDLYRKRTFFNKETDERIFKDELNRAFELLDGADEYLD